MTVRFDAVTVDWFGLATVRLEGQTGAVVYLDPVRRSTTCWTISSLATAT